MKTTPIWPVLPERRLRSGALVAFAAMCATTAACGTETSPPKQQKQDPAPKAARVNSPEVPPAVPFPVAPADSEGAETKLLRFPDIHGDLITFTYAGDLWLVKSSGGTASRLTAHPGLELFAKFSPDGRWIAFTGQYGGDEQVYVVPTGGGEPRQLTFYPAPGPLPARWGYDNQVYGWTPDGTKVLFRSLRDSFDISESRLFTIAVEGGAPEPLPMPVAGAGDLAPSGDKIVYSPLFRDFRTWKRYSGGWAQDLYIFDLAQTQIQRITTDPRSDRDPMWIGDRIYFGSDRDGMHNIYRYDPGTGTTEQVTRYKDWDVRWPSADANGQIVYELNGALHVLNTQSNDDGRQVRIFVPDDGTSRRPERISAAGNIESFALSSKGERALFVARGDVFTVPVKHGLTRNLTQSPNAHEREAHWSADGEQIVYVSDWTGEEELWMVDRRRQKPPQQLTRNTQARLWRPRWSPDGKRIAYGDQAGKLYVLTVAGGAVVEIADEPFGRVSDYVWSPDSQYLAFSLRDSTLLSSIYIWSLRDGQTRRITGELFDEYNPSWHPGGEHLYYLSVREFQPQIGQNEWNYVTNRGTSIFALALHPKAPNPFAPRNEEVGKSADQAGKDDKDKQAQPPPRVQIDFAGLGERVIRVPVTADNYSGLVATETHLLYRHVSPFFYGREPAVKPSLHGYALKERKAAKIADNVQNWAVSHDGKTVLMQQEKVYKIHKLGAPGGGGGSPGGGSGGSGPGGGGGASGDNPPIAVDTLRVLRIPAQEWQVIFNEVWRRFRDYFYVANMHGYDWEALREKYRPLLQHVGHRSDLNYLIGEMIAELNVSHAYIAGGDEKLPARPHVALPGARFALDKDAGRYRITDIFRGQNAEARYRAPLTEVGLDIAEGDYVLAINGHELQAENNPYELLQLPAKRPVEFLVNKRPVLDGARTVLFEPLTSEKSLLYLRWVLDMRRRVQEATEGRVAYLHVPDMNVNGIREFIKWYYGQVRKEGLIVDVRGNGGGNVSQMLIERLRRTVMHVDFGRNFDHPGTYPSVAFHGHMVTLINETSASDGDIFPWMFREAGLGPLIGKRTWGGIVGITNHGPLIDGGQTFVPEFANASADGRWVVEGVGVAPDIEVENDPVEVIRGRDPQLERAIEEVMKRIRDNPKRLPERPAPPVKTPDTMAQPGQSQ